MPRPTIRKSGKPLTNAERVRRYRAKKKAMLKVQQETERRGKRVEANGNLVADPFAGSGTTLRAALALGRRAWGSDIDAPAVSEPRDA